MRFLLDGKDWQAGYFCAEGGQNSIPTHIDNMLMDCAASAGFLRMDTRPEGVFTATIPGCDRSVLLENGEIDESLIDGAVLNILMLKLKVGLFENPYTDPERIKRMHSKEAVDLALKLDEESILLLENDGILPLDQNRIGTVAVIGNNGKESSAGDYIDLTDNCVDFYTGMVNRLGNERVLYAKGCNPISYTDEMISEAVNTAKKADVVFLVLGDQAAVGGGVAGAAKKNSEVTCGEGYDMHTLDLPPSQQKLFDEIIKLNKPTVLVLYAGRPYAIPESVKKVNAFMFSFGGGEQSGNAFANLIFGDKSPSAMLSVSRRA